MDLHFVYRNQHFVWNLTKAAANLAKHGMTFERACQALLDPLVHLQDASVEDESREAAIGLAEDWTLLFVVHLQREDNILRIISARAATAQERKTYEEHQ